jgi:hypothetical protein
MNVILDDTNDSVYRKKVKENCIFEDDYIKVPIFNKDGDIRDYTLIDKNDYDKVMKGSLLIKENKGNYKTICITIDRKKQNLSHYLIGSPKIGYIIDHNNNNSLDNRKDNLLERPSNENSQNKKKTTKKTSSIYIGVSFCNKRKKWLAYCAKKNLGYFDKEEDAAKIYDKYALIKFGQNASTNNLVKYEDIKDLTIDDIKPTKKRDLPDNIFYTKNNSIYACIIYKKKIYKSDSTESIEDAIKYLDKFKIQINQVKENEEQEHLSKEITRNSDGNAIIYIYNIKKEIVAETIVDDDKWHQLSKYNWNLTKDNYIQGNTNKKTQSMHRYLTNPEKGIIIDHINNNSLDNRMINLRPATPKQNSYNASKKKNASSIYKGVTYSKKHKNYKSTIYKDSKEYYLGTYTNEIVAGLAYNIKATELFGEFANLNKIDISDELLIEYKNEILEKWNKIEENKKLTKK